MTRPITDHDLLHFASVSPHPWRPYQTARGWVIYDADEDVVAKVPEQVDARLIATAPRLLDALRGMVGLVQLVDRDRPDLQSNHRFIEALAAIAEVEGGQ